MPQRFPRPRPLATALLLALPALALADETTQDHAHDAPRTLDAVRVTATPLRQGVEDLARPVEVLAGEDLDARKAGTLGETLERLPGVQSSSFGPGVGRPIIRGQDGARVRTLAGGIGSMDVSTVSVDHAVAIEPFLADQIEVLKGPAALLYGSGAIGGAVNVVDGRVPTAQAGRATSGRAEIRHGSAADESVAMARFDGDAGPLTLHFDGFYREAGDYRIPGFALSDHLVEEELEEGGDLDDLAFGRVPNTSLRTRGGAVGASWFGERAWFGAAASTYRSNYGIPPGAHAHHEEEEDGHEDDEHGHEEAAQVRIDLRQDRFDFRGGVTGVAGLRELNWRLVRSLYEHAEIEEGEIGTVFENTGTEARLELVQNEWAGWNGAFGLQYGHRDFSAVGEEAFVPPSVGRDLGLFTVQERQFGRFKLETGLRHDRVRVSPEGGASKRFSATSLALGGLWQLNDAVHLSLNLDRAERAPTAEELFSDGPHIATASYEIGDAGLDTERAFNAELGLHLHHGRFEGKLAVFRTRYDGFIYLADTGLEEDELPVRQWTQADARFTGWEAEARIELHEGASGLWQLRAFADAVDAELDGGERLPRIAPARIGLDLAWSLGGWRARLGAVRVAKQDEVAPNEEPTEGHTLVDAGLAWHWDTDAAGWELFLEGRNLTDREARSHTSYLKELAPLPGRNLMAGLRVSF
ncbi:TonB-dependent receptor [Arenimonas fontis]|uniref:TonB-dependent receptor n=1 Tax=Arenimonas fontis TaxID=2608255 RepID=A0A5B2ZAT4_9GAMM|nr:TonB-dependent receptor [Arenimonas fontis]KAA2285808.1 TonB-dependent receptor [Arenimonas fontis]